MRDRANRAGLVSARVAVEGARVHVRSSTAANGAPALVLVHGLMVSGRYLVPLAHRLAPGATVIVPDLPGFGRTRGPRRALGVGGLADAVAGLVGALGLERTNVLGHSMGAQVAVDLAVRAPDLVERLVLVGPTMDPAAPGLVRQLARWFGTAPYEHPALFPVLIRDAFRTGPVRGLATFREAMRDPLLEKLARLRAPTLVVRGERDRIAPHGWASAIATASPTGRVAVVPRAGHALNFSRPDALAAIVREFLLEPHPMDAAPPPLIGRAAP
jgi:pimeloyl-ACP methyl ester carboxylesterase